MKETVRFRPRFTGASSSLVWSNLTRVGDGEREKERVKLSAFVSSRGKAFEQDQQQILNGSLPAYSTSKALSHLQSQPWKILAEESEIRSAEEYSTSLLVSHLPQ